MLGNVHRLHTYKKVFFNNKIVAKALLRFYLTVWPPMDYVQEHDGQFKMF